MFWKSFYGDDIQPELTNGPRGWGLSWWVGEISVVYYGGLGFNPPPWPERQGQLPYRKAQRAPTEQKSSNPPKLTHLTGPHAPFWPLGKNCIDHTGGKGDHSLRRSTKKEKKMKKKNIRGVNHCALWIRLGLSTFHTTTNCRGTVSN